MISKRGWFSESYSLSGISPVLLLRWIDFAPHRQRHTGDAPYDTTMHPRIRRNELFRIARPDAYTAH
jgi:hypothetical protein